MAITVDLKFVECYLGRLEILFFFIRRFYNNSTHWIMQHIFRFEFCVRCDIVPNKLFKELSAMKHEK